MTKELVTAAELSRQLGIAKSSVSDKIKSGVIKPDGYTDSGKPLFNIENKKTELKSILAINAIKSNQFGLPNNLKKTELKKMSEKSSDKSRTNPGQICSDELKTTKNKKSGTDTNSGSIDIALFKDNLLGDDFDDLSDAEKYLRARAVKESISAAQAQIELDKSRELLVTKESIKQQGAELGITLIGALTALPDRLAPELSTLTDQHEIHDLLTNELNYMIAEIYKGLGVEME